ncbi:Protein kinase domain family protein [Pelomyxa schiedti]|nr:Protein kinase domain family protein [Pelomyxa schiedti]KAH3757493.1 Protein kinase domain family protein [Pelomyxa schiedti]
MNAFRYPMFLHKLSHKSIVKIVSLVQTPNDYIYVSFPYYKYDLDFLIRQNRLSFEQKVLITNHILHALSYLHSREVVHRSLRPSAVFLSTTNLSDSAPAVICSFDHALCLPQLQYGQGSPPPCTRYHPPEVLNTPSMPVQWKSADMWAAGCILGEMLMGRALFSVAAAQSLGFAATKQYSQAFPVLQCCTSHGFSGLSRLPAFQQYPADLIALLERLLWFAPTHRPTAQEALNHTCFAPRAAVNYPPATPEELVAFSDVSVMEFLRQQLPSMAQQCVP